MQLYCHTNGALHSHVNRRKVVSWIRVHVSNNNNYYYYCYYNSTDLGGIMSKDCKNS